MSAGGACDCLDAADEAVQQLKASLQSLDCRLANCKPLLTVDGPYSRHLPPELLLQGSDLQLCAEEGETPGDAGEEMPGALVSASGSSGCSSPGSGALPDAGAEDTPPHHPGGDQHLEPALHPALPALLKGVSGQAVGALFSPSRASPAAAAAGAHHACTPSAAGTASMQPGSHASSLSLQTAPKGKQHGQPTEAAWQQHERERRQAGRARALQEAAARQAARRAAAAASGPFQAAASALAGTAHKPQPPQQVALPWLEAGAIPQPQLPSLAPAAQGSERVRATRSSSPAPQGASAASLPLPGDCSHVPHLAYHTTGDVRSVQPVQPHREAHPSLLELVAGLSGARAHSPAALQSPSPHAKAQQWQGDDETAEAEMEACVSEHMRQRALHAAAMVLQTWWRARQPRCAFGAHWRLRRRCLGRVVAASFGPWRQWAQAAHAHRAGVLRRTLLGWLEVVQLETLLLSKMLRALCRGALPGEVPRMVLWRLCTPQGGSPFCSRPSLGAALAAIVVRQAPYRTLKAAFKGWRAALQHKQQLRLRLAAAVAAVDRQRRRHVAQLALRFWHRYAIALVCERYSIPLPLLRPRLRSFEEWLWRHVGRQQAVLRACAWQRHSRLARCFGFWRAHAYKIVRMCNAWAGASLYSPRQRLRQGLLAFRVHRMREQAARRLLRRVWEAWQQRTMRYAAAWRMRKRIMAANQLAAKTRSLAALRLFARLSRCLNTAAALKLWWHRCPALIALHAWRDQSGCMWFMKCWQAWRGAAAGRLRLRAAVAAHTSTARLLPGELCFIAWRKLACAHRASAAPGGSSTRAEQLRCTDEGAAAAVAVHASLADGPPLRPWRSLVGCGELMAPRALQAPPSALLAKRVRDLRELEGSFRQQGTRAVAAGGSRLMAPKSDLPGLSGLVVGAAFKRRGLMPHAGLPVAGPRGEQALQDWRNAPGSDVWWWQRLVGWVAGGAPHPDSWRRMVHHAAGGVASTTAAAASAAEAVAAVAGCSGVRRTSLAELECEEVLHAQHAQLTGKLAEAEALLEAAVHGLLGIGMDSSDALYAQLRQDAARLQLPMQGDLLAWLLKAAVVADTAAVAEQQQQPAGTAGSSPGVATTSPASAPAGMACATWVGGGAAGAAQQAAGSNPAVRLKSSLTPLRHSGSTTRREQLQASTQPSRLSQSAAARSSALQPLKAAPPSAPAAALPGSERAAPRVRRRGPHATDEAAAMALLLGPAADVQLERLQQAARVAAAELHRILPNRFTLSPQAELLRAESQAVALLSERMEEEGIDSEFSASHGDPDVGGRQADDQQQPLQGLQGEGSASSLADALLPNQVITGGVADSTAGGNGRSGDGSGGGGSGEPLLSCESTSGLSLSKDASLLEQLLCPPAGSTPAVAAAGPVPFVQHSPGQNGSAAGRECGGQSGSGQGVLCEPGTDAFDATVAAAAAIAMGGLSNQYAPHGQKGAFRSESHGTGVAASAAHGQQSAGDWRSGAGGGTASAFASLQDEGIDPALQALLQRHASPQPGSAAGADELQAQASWSGACNGRLVREASAAQLPGSWGLSPCGSAASLGAGLQLQLASSASGALVQELSAILEGVLLPGGCSAGCAAEAAAVKLAAAVSQWSAAQHDGPEALGGLEWRQLGEQKSGVQLGPPHTPSLTPTAWTLGGAGAAALPGNGLAGAEAGAAAAAASAPGLGRGGGWTAAQVAAAISGNASMCATAAAPTPRRASLYPAPPPRVAAAAVANLAARGAIGRRKKGWKPVSTTQAASLHRAALEAAETLQAGAHAHATVAAVTAGQHAHCACCGSPCEPPLPRGAAAQARAGAHKRGAHHKKRLAGRGMWRSDGARHAAVWRLPTQARRALHPAAVVVSLEGVAQAAAAASMWQRHSLAAAFAAAASSCQAPWLHVMAAAQPGLHGMTSQASEESSLPSLASLRELSAGRLLLARAQSAAIAHAYAFPPGSLPASRPGSALDSEGGGFAGGSTGSSSMRLSSCSSSWSAGSAVGGGRPARTAAQDWDGLTLCAACSRRGSWRSSTGEDAPAQQPAGEATEVAASPASPPATAPQLPPQQQGAAGRARRGRAAAVPAHLRQLLREYLSAYTRWRSSQPGSGQLPVQERWGALLQEEQVLDFLAALTLRVHRGLLLRHHGGVPPEEQRQQQRQEQRQEQPKVQQAQQHGTSRVEDSQSASGPAWQQQLASRSLKLPTLSGQRLAVPAAGVHCATVPRQRAARQVVLPAITVPLTVVPAAAKGAALGVGGGGCVEVEPTYRQGCVSERGRAVVQAALARRSSSSAGGGGAHGSPAGQGPVAKLASVDSLGSWQNEMLS